MSIEQRIAELTAALERNSRAIERWFSAFESANAAMDAAGSTPTTTTAPAQPQPQPQPVAAELTHAAVSDLCAKAIQKDRANGPKIKQILAEQGAKLIADLPTEKLPAVAEKIGALV